MDNKAYREIYEELSEEDREVIDKIYQVVFKHCKNNGIQIANDDRAEMFIGAITEYYMTSKEE
jgi:hypothetical protein